MRVVLSYPMIAVAFLFALCSLGFLAFWMTKDSKEDVDKYSAPIRASFSPIPSEEKQASRSDVGLASWYSLKGKTASGEQMNPHDMTAAHRWLPLGTRVRVEALESGRSVDVRINDRGPFVKSRIIDLSKAAAEQLGIADSGTASVVVRTIE